MSNKDTTRVSIEMRCDECLDVVDAKVITCGDGFHAFRLAVDPCTACNEHARDTAYAQGYDDGRFKEERRYPVPTDFPFEEDDDDADDNSAD